MLKMYCSLLFENESVKAFSFTVLFKIFILHFEWFEKNAFLQHLLNVVVRRSGRVTKFAKFLFYHIENFFRHFFSLKYLNLAKCFTVPYFESNVHCWQFHYTPKGSTKN